MLVELVARIQTLLVHRWEPFGETHPKYTPEDDRG